MLDAELDESFVPLSKFPAQRPFFSSFVDKAAQNWVFKQIHLTL